MPLHRRLWAFAIAAGAFAQSSPAPSFEVASIKPSRPEGRASMPRFDPALFSVRKATLKYLVMAAYGVPLTRPDRVTGGPSWTEMDSYDVDGTAGHAASREEMMLMLRALLTDRFQLKLHRETRPILTNVILVAKDGPKFGPDFHPVKEGEPPLSPGKRSLNHMVYPGVPFDTFLNRLHMLMIRDPSTGAYVGIQDVPPLLDETGLTGRYDIVFDAGSDESWSATLQRQLGLKLEERKVPTEILAIDSAAKPSAD